MSSSGVTEETSHKPDEIYGHWSDFPGTLKCEHNFREIGYSF